MKFRKQLAFVLLAGSLAVVGAGWKWGPHSKGPRVGVVRVAGWTWDAPIAPPNS